MKKTIYLISVIVTLALTSCNNEPKTEAHNDSEMTQTQYACPMKCEGDKTYDKPGQCPTCKMDLKEVK